MATHVEAIVQILTESAGLLFLFQRLVRGSDNANVGVDFLRAADAAIMAVFQHAQQLGLKRRRHLGHLVDEERAAFGYLKQADLGRHGPGERALLVAEQLAFQQCLL